MEASLQPMGRGMYNFFSSKILGVIKSYFLDDRYSERCGIVLKGNEQGFTPLPNVLSSTDMFQVNPKVFLLRDKIKTIVHSHPFGCSYPSELDVFSSRQVGVPYLIYSCAFNNFVYFDLEKCIPIKV